MTTYTDCQKACMLDLLKTAYAEGWAVSAEGYNYEHVGYRFDVVAWNAKRDETLSRVLAILESPSPIAGFSEPTVLTDLQRQGIEAAIDMLQRRSWSNDQCLAAHLQQLLATPAPSASADEVAGIDACIAENGLEATQRAAKMILAERRAQFEHLDVQNHRYRNAMRKIMARLTDLLDEDQFGNIESIVREVGIEPPESIGAAKPVSAPTVAQMVNRAREHGMDLGDNPVAYEFYNPQTGHAIVDYTRWTHVGHLTDAAGYEARPLVYASEPQEKPVSVDAQAAAVGVQGDLKISNYAAFNKAREMVATEMEEFRSIMSGSAADTAADVLHLARVAGFGFDEDGIPICYSKETYQRFADLIRAAAADTMTQDERAAVQFYTCNPSAAVIDLDERLKGKHRAADTAADSGMTAKRYDWCIERLRWQLNPNRVISAQEAETYIDSEIEHLARITPPTESTGEPNA